MHVSCMATKTITLEVDAYEMLRRQKRAGESFSAVVRRARFAEEPPTGKDLLGYFGSGGSEVSEIYLDRVAEAESSDHAPENPWA